MADDELPPPDTPPPPLNALIDEHVEQLFDVKKLSRLERVISNAVQSALSTVVGVVLSLAAKIGAFLGKTILDAENRAQPEFDELARVAIKDMFGVDVGAGTTTRGQGGNVAAADKIGDMMLRAFSGQARGAAGDTGPIQPGDEGAKAFLSAMAQLALEGWLEGWLVEALSLGQIETFGELDDTISHVLGLGRASASVHGPLVRHMIVEPLEWKIMREHRPTLLGASTVARQWFRGRWDWADVAEELARAGYSDERIDAILSEARRYISAEDVAVLAHRIDTATFDPKAYLRDMGFDELDAKLHLLAGDAKILDRQESQLAQACIDAYVRGDVNALTYQRLIGGLNLPQGDRAHYLRLGDLRRTLNVRQLTDGEAQQAVKKEIQSIPWYRNWLASQGYDDEAVAIKELLLRGELDAAADAAKLKAEQAADRAKQKADADVERAARVAAKAIADAQPAYSDVRRAYVRGLVDVGRLEAAIALAHPGIVAGDAAALVADADHDRATYAEQQQAHAAALARDADPGLPLSVLEQSVLRGITTITTYDAELARRGFDEHERAIYVALLADRLTDQHSAEAARAAAEQRAKLRGVSVADFERAVRLGLRTPTELAELLDQLGTPDVEKALILDLVARDMTDDQAAADKRAAADARAAERAINLPLRRRAVVKGIRSAEAYAGDLTAAGMSIDDQALELQLVTLERDDAAARAERAAQLENDRAAKEAAAAITSLSLAQLEHAVRLGLLQPGDLREYLTARGYASADVEILVASVVADIPTLRQAATTQAAAAGVLATKGISLAELEHAVARGFRSLDDYAGELTARGYGDDDVALLRELLAEKVGIDLDGMRKKVTTAIAAVDGAPTREELEQTIIDKQASDAAIVAYLSSNGVAKDVATVYVRLLHTFAPAPA
jgi:hypothetical protein